MIEYRKKWIRQPIGRVAVDWANPLAQGLQRCVVGGYAVDLAKAAELSIATAVQSVGQAGACRVYNGSQYDRYAIPAELEDATSGTSATVAAVYQLGSAATQRVVSLGFQSATGGIAITPSTTNIRGIAVNSALGNVIVTGASASLQRVYSTVFSTGDTARLYVDSNAAVSAAVSGGQRWVGADFFQVGADEAPSAYLIGRVYLACAWSRELTEAEARSFNTNPWQLFEPRRIWVPVSAGGTNTYTFSVSGGTSLSGTAPLVRERLQTPSGGFALAGSPIISRERAIEPSGQLTFSGSAPIVTTASYQFTPSGGVTFSGAPEISKEKIIPADGGVNFGGSSRLIFVPVGGVGTNDSDRISVGVSRKVGVS